ncbi:DNA cytosine methyltransferase [Kitasatospora viridis]|uniref:Cytosine-specific methyltransferase n=1 Tax=Kitasatospora viridis TaxID=281105 RepID=A0A561UCL7_9ACTN|nr:DNA cytosine methyltransferase [Kitasatospora viridis]TWF97123.1 DNA (cytosine-5)-methyltransferase 1 [Kitasatospora viridis]
MHTPGPRKPEPITVVDLFSGCGGFTQGFHEFRPVGAEDSGPVFHSLAAVEHDAAAAATYSANFGSGRPDTTVPAARIHFGDIEKWEPAPEDLHADVVVGGPPCQGFSALNRNKKGSERNRLWEEYVRIVAKIRPKVFVIENVDRFLKSDEFQNLLSELQQTGLLADYRLVDPPGYTPADSEATKNSRYLLNAANYGAVQARRRTIVIGVRRDVGDGRTMSYPVATHTRRPKGGVDGSARPLPGTEPPLPSWRAVDSVFAESAVLQLRGTELPERTALIPEVDDVLPGVFTTGELHIGRNPEMLSMARYAAIPPNGNRKDLRDRWYTVDERNEIRIFDTANPPGIRTAVRYLSTESWDKHNTGTGDVMGRLRLGEPSVTIRTEFFKPEKGRYLHPTDPRPITHFEAARIQGFPLDFRWCGSKTDVARQIGNAVPIPLGMAIASAIHGFLRA